MGRVVQMRFSYFFGYQTPAQRDRQERSGWDDEDSLQFFVDAEDQEAAYAWGRTIAEEFVSTLYAPRSISWKSLGYADGIQLATATDVGAFTIRAGEHPDYRAMVAAVRERGPD